jgi:pyrimidine-nucleoside phosphorylase
MLRQTPEITPADGKLYALRDVTATVESIPLIAASIMSKKLAEGLDGLVLDVKTGSGAFLPQVDRALELATTMIGLGESRGCPTVALLTAMDRPLGRALGNALEIEETIVALEGKGPADLMEVTLALADEMLLLAGVARDQADARRQLDQALASGAALDMLGKLIEAQGGERRIIDDPSLLPQAGAVEVYRAPASGTITTVEPRRIGRAITELGGGRRKLEDVIDPSVGFVITVKPGDAVTAGEPIASIFARDKAGIESGLAALRQAITIGGEAHITPLISHRVTARGMEVLA